jgi:DNA-binding XRE family transcriptional regulator
MNPTDLTAWREQHGLTKTALARALGVHWVTLYDWERGVYKPPSCLELALVTLSHRLKDAARKRRHRALERERKQREAEQAAVYRLEPEPGKFW